MSLIYYILIGVGLISVIETLKALEILDIELEITTDDDINDSRAIAESVFIAVMVWPLLVFNLIIAVIEE